MRKLLVVVSLLMVASMLLAACGAKTTGTSAPATQPPASAYADTIIVGTWQEPGTFYDAAVTQAIAVEVELMFRPWFVERNNFTFFANPVLIEGDIPSYDNGGAVLNDVTVPVGGLYFDTTTYMVQEATVEQNIKQLVVTGHIKAGLMWDDGQPLTTNDFVLAYDTNCAADATQSVDLTFCPFDVAGSSGIIVGYEAPDDTTIVATYVPGALDATYQLTPFGLYGILPSHLFVGMTAAEIEIDLKATGSQDVMPLGYGPYKMVAWAQGDSMTFAPNTYWTGTAPATPNIIYKFYSNSTSLAAAAIAGEIDSTSGITGLSVDQAPYMKSVASRGLIHYEVDLNAASFEMLYFNYYDPNDPTWMTPDPLLSEFCVRKAISLALNRQQMVDTIYYGDSAVVQQPQLPQMASYDESLGILAYDPELAKTTLDACGWVVGADGIREKNGVRASTNYLTTSGNAVRLKASQILQTSLKDIGIEVTLNYKPSSVAFSKDGLYGRVFNMMQFANVFSSAYPNQWFFGMANCGQIPLPENAMSGNNYSGWCNQAVSDAAADQGYLTADPVKLKEDWAIILAGYFSEGDPADFRTGGINMIPLYTRPDYLACSPLLTGAALDPTAYFTWNVETWKLALP